MAQDRPRPVEATTLPAAREEAAGGPSEPRRVPIPRLRPAQPPKPKLRPAKTYTVRKGDTLSAIAQRNGMTLSELKRKNPGIMKRARRLRIGSEVKL